jgi:hypothetical protein
MQMTQGGSLPETVKLFKVLFNFGVFVCTLVVTCGAIHYVLPPRPDIPVVSDKLAWLRKYAAHYDTLFLGTSRVYKQIMPNLFDERMREHGFRMSSYNLAADGMNFPETFIVLESALDFINKPKLVVLELGGLQRMPNPIFKDESLRVVHWHNWKYTAMSVSSLMKYAANTHMPALDVFEYLAWHFRHLTLNTSNLGSGASLLSYYLFDKHESLLPVGKEGCVYMDRKMTTEELEDFRNKLSAKHPTSELPVEEDAVFANALTAFASKLNDRGICLIFVQMPAFRRVQPPVPKDSNGRLLTVVDLDDVEHQPAFWEPEHRYDPHHLNKRGSQLFTYALADEIAAILLKEDNK